MSAKARKRSRPLTDEHRADCPFKATIFKETPQDIVADGHMSKKRKHYDGHGHEHDRGVSVQNSPFHPAGHFRTYDFARIAYNVEPWAKWLDMTRYNSFVLNGLKYCPEDYVYVANDRTVERHKELTTTDDNDEGDDEGDRNSSSSRRASDYWVAKILEIKASDEHHVYARIYWMYWPDELPAGTLDGMKTPAGRQPYHGRHELLASNHMDVINVVSVAMAASVRQWVETDDEETHDALYWRQAFDCRTMQFSSIQVVCRCLTPANPDKTLVGCTNARCEKWMHYECLLDDVLMRVYAALGANAPHITEKGMTVTLKEEEGNHNNTNNNRSSITPTRVKQEESVSPNRAPRQLVLRQSNAGTRTSIPTTTTTMPVSSGQGPGRSSSRHFTASRDVRRKKTSKKPYDGLFEATLKMDGGPMVWQVTDLRPHVLGGDKMWTEKALCLICNSVLD